MKMTYLRYHIGSASLVILSFAFIIFLIYKKTFVNEMPQKKKKHFECLQNIALLYLDIDEIVEWVNVLLNKPFHLEDRINGLS